MADTYEVRLKAMMDVSDVQSNVKAIQNALGKLKLPNNIDKGFKQNFDNVYKDIAKYQELLNKPVKTAADASQIEKLSSSISKQINSIRKDINSLNGEKLHFQTDDANLKQFISSLADVRRSIRSIAETNVNVTTFDNLLNKLKEADPASDKLRKTIDQLKASLSKGDTEGITSGVAKLAELLPRINGFKGDNFTQTFEKLGITLDKDQQNLQGLINKLLEMSGKANGAFGELPKQAQDLQNKINGIHANSLEDIVKTLTSASSAAKATSEGISAMGRSEAAATQEAANMSKQFKDLQQSTQYFFSLRNMFNLLKRGIRDAYSTIKDLDKAMTDTAVVTNMSVSDLWKQLPDYTELANRLGATTQGAYETMTLYYQQGLNQQQAFALGEETIKMARIAGQDYAETTDMMTAALRGFNMELNETSAQRVNDVYSQLAAKTASSTSEIGSAMERTASIAHSANMEFETTAAFLAQMIETTRESAENLGTAMKTIVARFQELKKNPNEIVEVDGEEVDYNRVDTALKSIGVSLVDNQNKFRDLDDVFLDIASHWDGLSQMQQRYVATMAAGSRQQSRFIAMMNNYERTQELVSYATDSAGASNEQFNKTLDSLEAKINKLKNAWDAFLMGITDNQLVKGAVDFATDFITQINKLIDGISGKNGLIQSIASIGLAFTGLKIGGKLMNSLVGGVSGLIDPQSSFTAGFVNSRAGNTRTINSIRTATQPIVQLLQRIAQIQEAQKAQSSFAQVRADYKEGRQAVIGLGGNVLKTGGSFTLSDINSKLANYDSDVRQAIIQNLPGYGSAIMRGANAALESVNFSEPAKTALTNFKTAMLKQGNRAGIGEAFVNRKSMLKTLRLVAPDVAKQAAADQVKQMKAAYQKQTGKNWDEQRLAGNAWAKGKGGLPAEGKKILQEQKQFAQQFFTGDLGGSQNIKGVARIANAFGYIGSAATGAGMAIMQVGAALDSAGFHGAASMLQSIGSGFMSLGMAVGGVSQSITGVRDLLKTVSKTSLGAFGIVGAVVGVLGFAWSKYQDHLEQVRQSAEEVTSSYNDAIDSTTQNLSKLNGYQERFNELAKGVDEFGNNINLSDADYDEYQQIVRDLVAINPEIIKGYNDQHQAIIDNNTALEETIKLQEQIQENATSEYTSPAAYQKLLDAQNQEALNNPFYTQRVKTGSTGIEEQDYTVVEGRFDTEVKKFQRKIYDISEKTEDGINFRRSIESILGVKLDSLTEDSIELIKEHRAEIENFISQGGYKIDLKLLEGLDSSFSDIESALTDADTLYGPAEEALKTWAEKQEFDFSSEFDDFFLSGVEKIARSANTDAYQQQEMVTSLAEDLKNYAGYAEQYQNIVDRVEKAQTDWIKSGKQSSDDYAEAVEKDVHTLIAWRDKFVEEYRTTKNETDRIMAEMLQNQLESIVNFSGRSALSIHDAFNTLSDELAQIDKAKEKFEEIAKNDYGTPLSKLGDIYSTGNTDNNLYAKGTKTGWAAAQELLSKKYWNKQVKNTREGMEAVKKQFNSIKGWFAEDNKESYNSFYDSLYAAWTNNKEEAEKAGLTFDDNGIFSIDATTDEKFSRLAELLGVSETLLASMLEKAKQFANINFTNVKELKKAIKQSETTYRGADGNYYTLRSPIAEEGGEDFTPEVEKKVTKTNKKGEKINLLQGKTSVDTLLSAVGESGGKADAHEAAKFFATLGRSQEQIEDWFASHEEILSGDTSSEAIADAIAEHQLELDDPLGKDQLDALTTLKEDVGSIREKLVGSEENSDTSVGTAEEYGITGNDKTAFDKYQGVFQNAFNQDLFSNNGEAYGLKYLYGLLQGYQQNGEFKDSEAIGAILKDYLSTSISQLEELPVGEQVEATDNLKTVLDDIVKNGYLKSDELTDTYSYLDKVNTESSKDFNKAKQDLITEYSEPLINTLSTVDRLYGEGAWSTKQFGNINLDKRQVQYNDKGEAETVLGDTIDTLVNGQSIPIACSFLLQTDDGSGTPKELSEDTVQEYFNQITQKALEMPGVKDESGNLIMDKFKSAVQDLDKQGLNMEGIGKVKELYADLGETAQETSEKMHFLGNDQELGHTFQEYLTDMKEIGVPMQEAFDALPNGVKNALSQTMSPDFWEQNYIAPISQATSKGGTQGLSNIDTTAYAEELTNTSETSTDTGVNNALSGDHTLTVDVNPGENPTITPEISSGEIKSSSAAISEGISKEGQKGAAATGKSLTTEIGKSVTVFGPAIQTGITNSGNSAVSAVQSTLNGLKASPKITPTLTRSVLKAYGEGGSSATLRIAWSAANGMNIGSAARGDHGMIGPKGKGGLTLTGEEGFEVAWLPSENRSMILGADGPQMTNLPKDAVVWDHKKSKKILERGGINIGSLANGTIHAGSAGSAGHNSVTGTGGREGSSGGGGNPQPKTKSDPKDKKRDKDTAETASNTKKIAAGEDNRKRILDAISNKLDKLSNKVSDKLEQVGTTYKDVASDIKEQVRLLTRSQKINTKVVDTYNKKLRNLDNLNKPTKIKDVGKVGNLGRFVYKDSETGAYQIDRKKLKKAYKGKKYEAVYNYLNDKINDYTSKRDEAQKNVDDAKAKLNDLTNQVKETFYDWENELTKLRNFSDKLELGDSFQSKLQAYMDMVDAKMLSGLGTVAEGAEAYRSTMQKMVSSMTTGVANATQKTAAAIEKYNKDTSLSSLKAIKQRANAEWKADRDNLKKRAAARKANEDYEAVKLAKDYISISTLPTGERTASIDWAKYEAARNGKGITDATNEAVTNYLETVIDDLKEIDDSVSDVYGRIQSLYELRTEALQTQADSAHTLISGMEAEAQEEIDKLNTINSTISNAFSELINKIRKELDRQRKLEQNEETERNISDQMNRLAMLRADTSGGNQVEIAQLERDIANARGDYEDSLEDQMLDRLQEQADEASKQREKQIKLLSAQLDQSKKTGEFVKKAEALVDAAAVGRLTPEEMADFRKYYQLANGGEDRTKYDDKLNSGSADQAMSELAGTQDTIDTVEKEVGELDKQVKIANTLDQHSGLTFTAIQDLWNQGVSVKELQGLGASWKDLVKVVKDLSTLKAAGMSAKDAKANGYTAQQMKTAKYSNKDILGAGWKGVKDAKDLAKVTENGKPVYSMKQIQKTTGINAKQAYNISKANNRGTKDLAGISGKVNIDTNKKKKGIEKKGANATVGTSGKSIASNVGSTLYVYDWSNGKQGDLLAKYAINEFNAKTFKNHPKEAKQALEYAIKHGKIGDLINKDFMNLAKTAKIIGNEYTTGDKKTVSVGGDGKLYYDSDDGVRVWNPGAGKTALYKKYDNKNKKIIDSFKKKAKAKGNINREFADVLKRYGITKYASGGLASDTGLAWLDGTDSKPELILNAADTKNFIALKNVLADLSRQGIFNDNGATGNATFDIDINVDKISSDYDVDKIAARVKKVITNEAKHRNVTVMGRSR